MDKKVVLIGAQGMLGHDLAEIFSDYELMKLTHSDLDITSKEAVDAKISELCPDIIVNAAAYTDVDKAEKEKALAMTINGYGAGYLAQAAKEIKATLIHFSTEYVFDGQNESGYNEDDNLSPLNVYGESKKLGEDLIRENCEKFYIIRSSWLYGHAPQRGKARGLNFIETMLSLAQQRDEINVVGDQFGRPTFTKDLALATKNLVEKKSDFGNYHLVNEEVCSWYDFAVEIFKQAGVGIKVNKITSEEYPLPTPRPKYGILNNNKADKLRPWSEALREYLENK